MERVRTCASPYRYCRQCTTGDAYWERKRGRQTPSRRQRTCVCDTQTVGRGGAGRGGAGRSAAAAPPSGSDRCGQAASDWYRATRGAQRQRQRNEASRSTGARASRRPVRAAPEAPPPTEALLPRALCAAADARPPPPDATEQACATPPLPPPHPDANRGRQTNRDGARGCRRLPRDHQWQAQ